MKIGERFCKLAEANFSPPVEEAPAVSVCLQVLSSPVCQRQDDGHFHILKHFG